jgi:hypothetical protein
MHFDNDFLRMFAAGSLERITQMGNFDQHHHIAESKPVTDD